MLVFMTIKCVMELDDPGNNHNLLFLIGNTRYVTPVYILLFVVLIFIPVIFKNLSTLK